MDIHSLRKNDSTIPNVMNIKTTLKMPNMKTQMKMETIDKEWSHRSDMCYVMLLPIATIF
jgi:hypothetical protein